MQEAREVALEAREVAFVAVVVALEVQHVQGVQEVGPVHQVLVGLAHPVELVQLVVVVHRLK